MKEFKKVLLILSTVQAVLTAIICVLCIIDKNILAILGWGNACVVYIVVVLCLAESIKADKSDLILPTLQTMQHKKDEQR